MKMMALNAYENDGSSEHLWTPMKIVALNSYENDGFERLLKQWWVLTPLKRIALNTFENDGGFERLWK